MSIETKLKLNESTIKQLQELIQINLDSREGFETAAEAIEDKAVAALFRDLAQTRGQFADELSEYVDRNGAESREEGSYAAAFHRFWIDLRAKLNGEDSHVVLSEAERGEDHIKAAYEDALKTTAGSAMNDVLTRQYAAIKSGHDRVRDLRDAHAAAK